MSFGSIAILLFDLALLQLALGLVLERRSPAATWFWLVVLFFAPIVGLPIYLLVGRAPVRRTVRRHGRRMRAQREALRAFVQRGDASCDREVLLSFEPLANLVVGVGGSAPRAGHRVHCIQEGPELVSRMVEALGRAVNYAYFETYIYEDGDAGRTLREALTAAARRGVEVRVLCDAVGSSGLSSTYFAELEGLGGRIEWFAPLRFWKKRRRPDLRNHRKVLVVDGRESFVGGFNISDEYVRNDRPRRPWRDTHAHIQGPASLDLEALFLESWAIATGEIDDAHAAETALQILGVGNGGESGCAVQVLAGGPEEDWPRLELAYLAGIHAARVHLDIATPYFVPSESVCSALAGAALRGVRVRLLLPAPEANDVRLVSWASRSYYAEMLDAGVRIFEYGPRMHHAKTLVADGLLSFIGTANLDMRSLRLNYEIATMIYDPSAAAELVQSFEQDLRSAREITVAELADWGRLQRLRNALAKLLSPLL
jgi:cardiolipin synthase